MFIVAFALLLQTILPSADQQQAYLTADPVNMNTLGLATADGRYMVYPLDGCDWVGPDINVTLMAGNTTFRTIGSVDQPLCRIQILQQMDTTPCEQNDNGQCDIAIANQP
jgi:hypothetical protein